jgi:hypothetical protein
VANGTSPNGIPFRSDDFHLRVTTWHGWVLRMDQVWDFDVELPKNALICKNPQITDEYPGSVL